MNRGANLPWPSWLCVTCCVHRSVLTCGCCRVCFFRPFCLQSLSLSSLWSRTSTASCTKASVSIVPLAGRSAAAAQEGAGSTRCGTGPPARPAALGPTPDVLGAALETPGSSSLPTSGTRRRREAGTINKVNMNIAQRRLGKHVLKIKNQLSS